MLIQLIWTDLKDGTRRSQLIGPTGDERINHMNGPYYKEPIGDWAAENEAAVIMTEVQKARSIKFRGKKTDRGSKL